MNNTYCTFKERPRATVRKSDITDTHLYIRDLDLRGCTSGSLYGNVSLWRGVEDPATGAFAHTYVTSYPDFYFGEIACNPACLSCNGTMANDCLMCANYTT